MTSQNNKKNFFLFFFTRYAFHVKTFKHLNSIVIKSSSFILFYINFYYNLKMSSIDINEVDIIYEEDLTMEVQQVKMELQ
jgi:hypothetical protein